jgi:hypothetical protein
VYEVGKSEGNERPGIHRTRLVVNVQVNRRYSAIETLCLFSAEENDALR